MPAAPIVNVTSEPTEIYLSWRESNYVGKIVNWTVEIKSLGQKYQIPDYCEPDNYNDTFSFDGNIFYTDINSLKPYTKYNISVRAITSEGASEKTIVTVETKMLSKYLVY